MNVRIGINPLTWSNDDLPALGAEIPLQTCLREARAAGYQGIELGHKLPREPERLRAVLAEHGLALVSGWYSLRLLERDAAAEYAAMRAHRELLVALGCRVVIVAETSGSVHGDRGRRLSTRPRLRRAQWPLLAARLGELATQLTADRLQLAYHHHMGTVIETEDEIDELLERCAAPVGLLLDTGHLSFAGGDPVRCATRHAGRIIHVHCKDVRPAVVESCRNRDASFLDAVLDSTFTVPGDGGIDFVATLAPLAAVGYRGWLVVEAEQDPNVAEPAHYARLGYRHLHAIVEALP